MPMRLKQNSATIVVVVVLAAVGFGVYRTSQPASTAAASVARRSPSDRSVVVDQSSLITAEQLVRLPTTSDERPFAQDALRVADQEMDLAFAQAVRVAAARPRAPSPEAKAIDAKLKHAENSLAVDSASVTSLTAEAAKAAGAQAATLSDRLNLAKALAALDQDEVDDARQDLMRAGGDPQGRMQAMIDEHDAASRSSDSVRVVVTPPSNPRGLINTVEAWRALFDKEAQLKIARAAADSLADAFAKRHDRLEARAAAQSRDPSAQLTHDSSAALLAATQRLALNQKTRSTLDQRVDNQHLLSDTYAGWITALAGQQRALVNRLLQGVAEILVILLIGMLVWRWTEHAVEKTTMDRRRAQTLDMVVRVSLQVLGVLFVLLVIFGPPNNLGTFLGLAGAGLTVALKDFIIAFIGWFVLMGKNGIRIGDLVEINGVTGEVVELGLFYTVLLETGSWSESGHPTGRRVTFTNGFAIEGHYFNFSTSGQWLWDEVQIVVPGGRDPYPIVEAIQRQVESATADAARQAEAQWRSSRRSPHIGTITSAPSVSLKPVSGGVEITVRYITHVAERADVRGKLYQTAVDLLGSPVVAPRLRDAAATVTS